MRRMSFQVKLSANEVYLQQSKYAHSRVHTPLNKHAYKTSNSNDYKGALWDILVMWLESWFMDTAIDG